MKDFTKNLMTMLMLLFASQFLFSQEYRSIDGYNNNLAHPEWGTAGVNQLNYGTVGFADGISEPAGADRPNPRYISNSVFMQNSLTNDPRGLSAYAWVWGQFIDHDITLVKDNSPETFPISIPPYDPFFDPAGTGTAFIPVKRSEFDPSTGTGPGNPMSFVNSITAYLDGSAVYGSDVERSVWLRTFSGGKLKTSTGNLLPFNTTTGQLNDFVDPAAPEMAMPLPVVKYFVAGDLRANENPFLVSMHTLFMREHNRLCDELAAEHPTWTDEQLYQHARKLVGAIMQAIVYEEWLPTLGMEVPAYNGYNYLLNPGIMNVFSAAAYRYGHTTITSLLLRMDNDGNHVPQGDILLRNAFFNPAATLEVNGIDPYLIGMSTLVQQDFDCKVIDDLRNFLFGQPGAGGMDLVAINIQRGRERGLADYNTIRSNFGLPPLTSFNDFSSDPLMNLTLEQVYGDLGNIDPWVGMLAEDHMPDALFGKTAMTIVKQQFMTIRDGDRFYYENDPWLTSEEKQWIKATRLSEVIRRNTNVTAVGDDIFIANPILSATQEKEEQARLDLGLYPNPALDVVSLRLDAAGARTAAIQVTDLSGKVVLQKEMELIPGTNVVPLQIPAGLPVGIYNVTVLTDMGKGHERFVRLRS